ncbi:MAG: ABC transporter permease [Thermoleophilia bacterium]|nr:ABC transporter permease [Thermoleophilia bacterium]
MGGHSNAVLGFLSPVVILVLWEIAVPLGLLDGRFFPPPHAIAGTFWKMVKSGQLFSDVYVSLYRIILGFLAGAIPGLIIGLSMGLFKPVRWLLRPIISATYPIPKLALMPLIILMFGFGETQKVITIALGTFFMVLINTMAGVLNLDKIYLDVAKNYGASRRDFYLRVALPGALPLIFTGLELGMGMALLLIVAAEMTGAVEGIGYRIWAAQAVFKTKEMFVAFILISLLGYIFAEALSTIQRKVIPWKSQ